ITAEINSYKQIAGNAIFEIGRRLKQVRDAKMDSTDLKERTLAEQREQAGGWIRWLSESVDFTRMHAHRFITVYETFGNDVTSGLQMGVKVLYEIATLPAEERERPHTIPSTGVTKTVDEMTVRELREVKAALKKAEETAEAERKARERAENEAEVLRQTIDSIEEQPPRIEYVRDASETERLRRYEDRFGDIET
ncbi:DUF3102 domain-containing protein, partial [Paenibacillus vulneris]